MTTTETGAQCRAYIADLAAYNNGHLWGRWLDLDGLDAEDIKAEIGRIIESSPEPGAEEYAVHDWDGVPSHFGEWPDWERVADYVAVVVELDDMEREAFDAWLDNSSSGTAPSLDAFREEYAGTYEDGEEYAGQLAEDTEAVNWRALRWPLTCIDWGAAFRELEIGGDIWSHRGSHGLHVFRNY